MKTDLLELIEKNEDYINEYLGSVDCNNFIRDVTDLIKKVSSKELIDNIIENLQKIKNGTQI